MYNIYWIHVMLAIYCTSIAKGHFPEKFVWSDKPAKRVEPVSNGDTLLKNIDFLLRECVRNWCITINSRKIKQRKYHNKATENKVVKHLRWLTSRQDWLYWGLIIATREEILSTRSIETKIHHVRLKLRWYAKKGASKTF